MDPTEGTEGQTTEGTDGTLPTPEATLTPDATAEDLSEATADNDPDPDEDDEDPVEAAVQARLAQEADKMAEAAMERARREHDERELTAAQRRAADAEAERLANSFANAIRESYAAAKQNVRYTDGDGNELTMDDRTFEEVVVKPMQKFNSTAEQAYQMRIYGILAQSALDSLPADQRDAFAKQAAGKPLPEWLKTYAEMLAPHTSFAKSIEKDTETKVKAAEARAFVKGQKAPGGTPKVTGGRTNQTNQPDLSTAFGIGDALGKGLIDNDTASKAWGKLNN